MADHAHDQSRRRLLKFMATGFAAVAAALWGVLPACAREAIARRFPTRTVERATFGFDAQRGEVVWKDGRRERYQLLLDGLVEQPLRLDYAQLRALPQARLTADFHCVEGWSVNDAPWGGVRFADLFALVRLAPGARFAVFHSLGETMPAGGLTHYVECLPIAELLNPALGSLLALDLDGAPLTDDRGAPARVISPFDHAYKSIKFVTRVEFTAAEVPGWWTRANPVYPVHAPVEKHRLRSPDPRDL